MDSERSLKMIEQAVQLYPNNDVVLESTARVLMKSKKLKYLDQAIKNLRKLVVSQPSNPHFYDLLSIAYYNALKPIQSGEAMARKEHLMGRNYRAVRILKNLKKEDGLDYYQNAEINALIAAYEPLITDRERQAEIQADRGVIRRWLDLTQEVVNQTVWVQLEQNDYKYSTQLSIWLQRAVFKAILRLNCFDIHWQIDYNARLV